jgi:hypothetical protein
MVNSRQLAEHVAASLEKPLTSTLQHAKNLREAKGAKSGVPLVTAGGRGRHAPTMSRKDAATLICAILGSEAIQDSVKTVESMLKLKPEFHGYRFKGRYRYARPHFDVAVGIQPQHNVVEALECVIRFFDRETEYRMLLEREGFWDSGVYVRFEVEFPEHFVSLTFGVRRLFSAAWTYGRRTGGRNEQLRRCRQDALREISEILRSTADSNVREASDDGKD